MKFGQTLYERSIPQWATHNLNYNELKQLIKRRTGQGPAAAIPIPGQSDHRWSLLEDELYGVLKGQYNNIALFIRSKHGELERRLAYLDKSTRTTKRAVAAYAGRPNLQARKYQKLNQDLYAVGEDIEALAQFASTQKLAFKKILKKYRKWTKSSGLQHRLEEDVFGDGQLDINTEGQMQQLTALQAQVNNDLQSILFGSKTSAGSRIQQGEDKSHESPINKIQTSESSPLLLDAALACVSFGESSGLVTYWVHPDNLDAARVMLLRYVKELEYDVNRDDVFSAYFDNGLRYAQDATTIRPSRIALSTRWHSAKNAVVTMSDLAHKSSRISTYEIKRKDLAPALSRESPNPGKDIKVVTDFLSQHRDIKGLAQFSAQRSFYVGTNNNSEVAMWATLDTNIVFQPFSQDVVSNPSSARVNSTTSRFPHAVLSVRWEFSKKPELVHALDTTHLVERVKDFSIEAAAINNQQPGILKPSWLPLLEQDIRKVPVLRKMTSRRLDSSATGTSAPSSTDGPPSVFSASERDAAGSETSPMASTSELTSALSTKKAIRPKKKARIDAGSPRPSLPRYYSEYDDPDSELYQGDETYTIYIDPNADAPGVAALKKIGSGFTSMFNSKKGSRAAKSEQVHAQERTSLLGRVDEEGDVNSSDSETDVAVSKPIHKGIPGRKSVTQQYQAKLSRRQRQHESVLVQFSYGLFALSYVFLLMSATLLVSGRRKQVLTVDVGATIGVTAAFICMISGIVLVYMRKSALSLVEKITLTLTVAIIIVLLASLGVGIVQKATVAK